MGAVALPFALPLLPVETYIRYARTLGMAPSTEEHHRMGLLPQQYADMFGWEELVDEVERAYKSLSPEEQARCSIFAQNYGEAGAIDYFGPSYGLPRAISPHNNYYLWGPGDASGNVVIAVGMDLHKLNLLFADVQKAATIENPDAIPDENNLPVYICRNPRAPLSQAWPWLKFFG